MSKYSDKTYGVDGGWRLVDDASGQIYQVGDMAENFRGEEVLVEEFQPPHKEGSQGRVTVREAGASYASTVYASVIGATYEYLPRVEAETREGVFVPPLEQES